MCGHIGSDHVIAVSMHKKISLIGMGTEVALHMRVSMSTGDEAEIVYSIRILCAAFVRYCFKLQDDSF